MKLLTSIPPRRDGTVIVTAKDGTRCVFAPGPDGDVAGEVSDEKTVAELLAGGLFFPADPADYDAAMKISAAALSVQSEQTGAATAGETLLGSDNFEAVMDLGDKQVQLGEIVARAFAASGMTAAEWNALDQNERDDLIEAELDRMENPEGDGDEKPAGGQPVESNTAPKDPPAPAAKAAKAAKNSSKK